MQKRDDILRGAERVFRQKNYLAATTEEIAGIAGYSVGTIYNLFKSKEGLFGEVVLAIARDLIHEVENIGMSPAGSLETLLERQIDLRIENQDRYGLFFQMFIHPGPSTCPSFDQLPKEVYESYVRYMAVMERFFAKYLSEEEAPEPFSTGLVLSFDGFVQMYAGYQEHARERLSRAKISRFVKSLFADTLLRKKGRNDTSAGGQTGPRWIFITQYDRIRLLDLISVFRSLQNRRVEKHLITLEQELKRAKIVQPNEIPADTVTMNSRVKIRDLQTQEEHVYTLAFPVDAVNKDHLSILDPVGTAMLGHRVGDVFDVPRSNRVKPYLVVDLLYQPEAAKDFHL